jgi:hypothetical protein
MSPANLGIVSAIGTSHIYQSSILAEPTVLMPCPGALQRVETRCYKIHRGYAPFIFQNFILPTHSVIEPKFLIIFPLFASIFITFGSLGT